MLNLVVQIIGEVDDIVSVDETSLPLILRDYTIKSSFETYARSLVPTAYADIETFRHGILMPSLVYPVDFSSFANTLSTHPMS